MNTFIPIYRVFNMVWLGILTALGLFAATFMSFNVSAFACIAILFVATMGTGGTITGTARALKELAEADGSEPPTIVGVDAVGSLLKQWFEEGTMGESHTYKVEGFGEDFIPSATDFSLIDADAHRIGH